ncbi:DivIVA domain-containing protein [Raineyella sp.]|uniref:DivIVA domain-containing protein n=1 Tax=Raineyella sp. TaxID=1911550 RepID=UPI002B21BCDD|nr:DivIVA domain-containing protein [Raineyella sp.]MEA5155239.1 DivIVA domain-containing protein [Raineyella sp.]
MPDNEGLDLFDETASAVGSFPTAAWGGYNKVSVDEYLRSLEAQIANLKRVQRDLRRTVDQQRSELDKPVQMDFSNLGSHATQMLSTAEAQAREITDRANSQAEQILAETRQQAAEIRNNAERDAEDLRTTTLAEARALRERWETETQKILAATRAEAEALVSTARQHSDDVTGQADAQAELVRSGAEVEARAIVAEATRTADEARDAAASTARATLDAAQEEARRTVAAAEDTARTALAEAEEKARTTLGEAGTRADAMLDEARAEAARLRDEARAESTLLQNSARSEAGRLRDEVAEEVRTTRAELADEREKVLATLIQEKERVQDQTARMLADALARHEALIASIAEETERAQRLRTAAAAEAEQTKVLAAREGQQLVNQAHKEAESAHQTVADRWAERQSRLRRETDLLTQRKHAILAQLSNLSALAGTTAEDFPDMEFGALDELGRDPIIDLPPENDDPEVVEEATVVLDRASAEQLAADGGGTVAPAPDVPQEETPTQIRPVPSAAGAPDDAGTGSHDPQQAAH